MRIWALSSLALLSVACREVRDIVPEAASIPVPTPSETTPAPTPSETPPAVAARYLYIASGACYGGGATVDTASATRTVSRWNLSTGSFERKIIDYAISPGDNPVGLVDNGASSLLVLIENTGGRRIDRVFKDGSGYQGYFSNATVLSAVLRGFARTPDGGLIISKSSAVEKLSSINTRIPAAGTFINNPAAPCATSNVLISALHVLPNGMIAFAHANTSPNNRLGVVSGNGYVVAADCKAGQAAPVTTALPSAMFYHPTSNRLFVAYGSATLASNQIWSYAVDQTTGAFSDATEAYNNPMVVNGPTAMTFDPETGDVFVAIGVSGTNAVEKFRLDATGKKLTRIGNAPFILPSSETRCPSALLVSD